MVRSLGGMGWFLTGVLKKEAKTSASYMEVPKDNQEVAVTVRDTPPAHYTLKVESFSLLSKVFSELEGDKKYESDVFEAGGYKWNLVLHPNGDESRGGDGHISLYLMIAETDKLPLGWTVDVNFKLFVYDQIRDKYYTYQDPNGKVRRFHAMKSEWGFSRLLSLKHLNMACNGFLVGDTCVFGAEVSVVNYTGNGECLSTVKTVHDVFTWKIENFLGSKETLNQSMKFTAGGHKWSLSLYPRGESRNNGDFLSIFLRLDDTEPLPQGKGKVIFARCMLLMKNQLNNKDYKAQLVGASSRLKTGYGLLKFMSYKRLTDPSEGFLVNNTLIVEATINVTFRVKNLP